MSGLSFFFTCMLLPLVGPAGVRVSHAGKNQVGFLLVLLLTFVLAAGSAWLKLLRRKEDQSPLPLWSFALSAACILIFVLQVSGLLAV
jgi:drug/metabolite transporter (DMT)-like permease